MKELLSLLNSGAVGVYGAILSAAFCNIGWTKRNKQIFVTVMFVLGCMQITLFTFFGELPLRIWYPVITHLPLIVVLSYLSKRKLWSILAVLTAYLCCQLRRWVGLFCVVVFVGNQEMQVSAELISTIPMLFLILRFVAPSVRTLSEYGAFMQIQLMIIPLINYLFDYITRVYTDWLDRGIPAVVEFMPFVCSLAYLWVALHITEALQRQNVLEQTQAVLDLEIKQAARNIEQMKTSQAQAAEYRHDLRHHLQYISECLEHQSTEQALVYMRRLNEEIMQQPVEQYCENIAVNLIMSVYAGRAKAADIVLTANITLGRFLHVSDNDLCVVFSNALENALHACMHVKAADKKPVLEVRGYERDDRIFIEIINSCQGQVLFKNDVPISSRQGHGIGVQSICAVVDKYRGVYHFEQKEDTFILRVAF